MPSRHTRGNRNKEIAEGQRLIPDTVKEKAIEEQKLNKLRLTRFGEAQGVNERWQPETKNAFAHSYGGLTAARKLWCG